MAKKAKRNTRQAPNKNPDFSQALEFITQGMPNIQEARTREAMDSRSNVLIACASALESMQATIQMIAKAAVEAPSYMTTSEIN